MTLPDIPPALVRPLMLLSRVGFFLAAAAGTVIALLPSADSPQVSLWDKAQHFAGFYLLAALGAFAFPRLKAIWLGLGLVALGGAIEIVQGLPIIGRDCDVRDWIADILAIACALAPLAIAGWRRRRSSIHP